MDDEDQVIEPTIEVDEEIVEPVDEDTEEIDWKARAEKAEKNYEDQRGRNDKLERDQKASKKPADAPKKKPNDLSTLDTIALVKSNVEDDDIEEIVNYANYKGISVRDALKDNVVKAIINDRSEERRTAEATNTTNARRSNAKLSEDSLLQNARSGGKLPDSDADMQRLAEAHMMANRKKTPGS